VTNDKQWQENSDGWVKAMTISKEKKEAKRKLQDMECNHGDLEWCEGCAYDINGERVAFKGIDY
tara:strand:- start:2088 stop:2279 length:192 start_codon:yes stop_codon:yes gene_type:complete